MTEPTDRGRVTDEAGARCIPTPGPPPSVRPAPPAEAASAGTLMSDEPSPYTDADIRHFALVLKAHCADCRSTPSMCPEHLPQTRFVLRALAEAGRLLPEGTRSRGMCGVEAPTLFGAGLDLQVCELLAGHSGWHGRPNAPGEPWMNWTERMVVHAERDEETDHAV